MELEFEVKQNKEIYDDMPGMASVIIRDGDTILGVVEVWSRKLSPTDKAVSVKFDTGMFGPTKFEHLIRL